MIQKIFGLLIIMCISIPFAHDTLISTAVPYASGIVSMNADSDTVSFSNGVKIFSLVFTPISHIPEESVWYGGIAFLYSSGKMAYKNDSSLIRRGDLDPQRSSLPSIHMAQWTMTIGNPDTNWSSALRVPQAFYPADSLRIRTSESQISLLTMKQLYYSQRPVAEIVSPIGTTVSENTNSIIYFIVSAPSSPNMKFQVASISKDSSSMITISSFDTYKNYIASGMTIRWAIDSLGNGLFHQSTNIRTELKIPFMKAEKASCKFLKLNNSNHLSSRGTYVSLHGEKTSKIKSKGIFIVRQ
jgi:hypothetical protein